MYSPEYCDDLRGNIPSFEIKDFDDVYESRRKLIEKELNGPDELNIRKIKKGRTKPKHRRKKR